MKCFYKIESSTFAKLSTDQGLPGPYMFTAGLDTFHDVPSPETVSSKWENLHCKDIKIKK